MQKVYKTGLLKPVYMLTREISKMTQGFWVWMTQIMAGRRRDRFENKYLDLLFGYTLP